MKKFLLFLLFLFPFSAFAWTDTDRLCADDTKWWNLDSTSVSVLVNATTWEQDAVYDLWKTKPPWDQDGYNRLYYVVLQSNWKNYTRSDIYMYNCTLKKPTLLLKLPIQKGFESTSILYISQSHIVLTQASQGELSAPSNMIVLDTNTNKKIFTLSNIDWYFNHIWAIRWFAEWTNAWYFIYDESYTNEIRAYAIDKKTKKLKKL